MRVYLYKRIWNENNESWSKKTLITPNAVDINVLMKFGLLNFISLFGDFELCQSTTKGWNTIFLLETTDGQTIEVILAIESLPW